MVGDWLRSPSDHDHKDAASVAPQVATRLGLVSWTIQDHTYRLTPPPPPPPPPNNPKAGVRALPRSACWFFPQRFPSNTSVRYLRRLSWALPVGMWWRSHRTRACAHQRHLVHSHNLVAAFPRLAASGSCGRGQPIKGWQPSGRHTITVESQGDHDHTATITVES